MQLGDPVAVYHLDHEGQVEALAWALVRRRAKPGLSIHPASAGEHIRLHNAQVDAKEGAGRGAPVSDDAAHRLLGGL